MSHNPPEICVQLQVHNFLPRPRIFTLLLRKLIPRHPLHGFQDLYQADARFVLLSSSLASSCEHIIRPASSRVPPLFAIPSATVIVLSPFAISDMALIFSSSISRARRLPDSYAGAQSLSWLSSWVSNPLWSSKMSSPSVCWVDSWWVCSMAFWDWWNLLAIAWFSCEFIFSKHFS